MRKILFTLCIFSILGSHPATASETVEEVQEGAAVAERCDPAGAALAVPAETKEAWALGLDLPAEVKASDPVCTASLMCPDGVTYLTCEGYSHCFNITYCMINCDGNRLWCPGCIEP